MMKLTYLLAAILAFSAQSCKSQTDSENTTSKSIVQAHSEKVGDNQPVHLTKDQFLKKVMNYEKNTNVWVYEGEKPCLVDFYADWCAPCRITSPILEDLAKQYAGRIVFYKVDIDEEQELAAVFGIQSIPSFLFCPLEGDPTMSSGIANTPAATRAMFIRQIEELLLNNEAKPEL